VGVQVAEDNPRLKGSVYFKLLAAAAIDGVKPGLAAAGELLSKKREVIPE
jgi:hypothetical protein